MAKVPQIQEQEYRRHPNSICIVAYDLTGAPVSDETVNSILAAVEKATKEDKLAISFTRE